MDAIRLGLSIRALRRRRGWTQAQLAAACGISRALVSKLEVGRSGSMQLDVLALIASGLGARMNVRISWHGEELDRLLDRAHAQLVELVVVKLHAAGWLTITEATFRIYGERGSIDVLALHPPTGALLVVEVKSVVPDLQGLLGGLDRKLRLAPIVARERGWTAGAVSCLLVLPDDRTARRRLDRFEATIGSSLPARSLAVRRWLKSPSEPVRGVLFLPNAAGGGSRQRISARRSGREREAAHDR
jgi:transcriptional regulator with XRE-family HTH domain